MREVLEKIIEANGKEAQMIVAVEELSELQKEICKYLRGKPNPTAMAEEIADVLIMIEQLRIMMPEVTDEMVDIWRKIKLSRIRGMLEKQEIIRGR